MEMTQESSKGENDANGTMSTLQSQGDSLEKSAVRICETPWKGRLDIVGSEAKYLGATHWASILDSVSSCKYYVRKDKYLRHDQIREIQGALVPDMDDKDEELLPVGSDITFDTSAPLIMTDVFNSLPPRPLVDNLLSVFFNSRLIQIRKNFIFHQWSSSMHCLLL